MNQSEYIKGKNGVISYREPQLTFNQGVNTIKAAQSLSEECIKNNSWYSYSTLTISDFHELGIESSRRS